MKIRKIIIYHLIKKWLKTKPIQIIDEGYNYIICKVRNYKIAEYKDIK